MRNSTNPFFKYPTLLIQAVSELFNANKEEFCEFLQHNGIEIPDIEISPESIAQEISFSDIIGDDLLEFANKILEDIRNMDIMYLYKKGKLKAMEKRQNVIEHYKKKQKIAEKEAEKSNILWEKLPKLYKLRYGSDLPYKIDKSIKYQEKHFSNSVLEELKKTI